MYDRIIVPIEESTSADSLDHARPLARALGCSLTLLHVHHVKEAPAELEGLPQYRYQGVVESWDEQDHAAEEHEAEWLREMAARVAESEPELKVTSRVVHAPLSRRLREEGEAVLVLAPAGDTHLDGLDRTLRELLRDGDAPLLLFRPEREMLPIRRILVALDGSRFSEEILGPALELATATDARLSLVEVVTRRTGLVGLLRPGDRSPETAERSLREVRGRIPEALGSVDVRVVEMGNAAAGIAAETRREDVDLVAMATHGRGGLRRMLLGSVAESVVRRSHVPVLLYRPRGDVESAGPRAEGRSKIEA